MAQSSTNRRRRILEDRLNQLYEDLEVTYAQIGRTLNDADIVRLKRQVAHLEREIKDLEQKIAQLDQTVAEAESYEESTVQEMDHQVVINLTFIFVERFNREELRTFCFHLKVDYEDLPAEGKANKARELSKYLHRHERIEESIALGKRLRPDIEWDRLSAA